jgi:crotonobetainyl-CoA:carnitine CoA-transferase CaiB-like acyl-CoA transferase
VGKRLPISPVADAADLHRNPHLAARGALRPIETSEFGPIVTPAPAPRLARSAPVAANRTPDVDEHGAEVRKRLLQRD